MADAKLEDLTEKTSFADDDLLYLVDPGGSPEDRYITGANVKATLDTAGYYKSGGTDVAVADGGTGASTATNARANLISAPAEAMDVLPAGAIAQAYSRWLGAANLTGVLTSQRLNLYGVYLGKGRTVSSITFYAGTTALASGVHQFFGLYDSSLGLLGTSANDTSTAWASNTPKTLDLTSPFVTTYEGMHYVGILVQAGTMPTLLGFNSGNTNTIGIAPILGGESTGSLTSLPATAGALTSKSNFPYFYLS